MNTSHRANVVDVVAYIDAVDSVYVRMALTRSSQGELEARSILVDVLPEEWLGGNYPALTAWLTTPTTVEYESAMLLSCFMRSKQVREWFGRGQHILSEFDRRPGFASRGVLFSLPALPGVASVARFYSYSSDGYIPMTWPHTLFRFDVSYSNTYRGHDMTALIAPDAPSYPDFLTARAELVHGVTEADFIYQTQDSLAVRVVRAEAWLNEVHIGEETLTADVYGTVPAGIQLQVSSPPLISMQQNIFAAGHFSIPIPRDPLSRLVVSVTRMDEELDRVEYNIDHPRGTSCQIVVDRDVGVTDSLPMNSSSGPRREITDSPTYLSNSLDQDVSVAGELEQGTESSRHPKIFISYSQDSASHRSRVLEFANRLIRSGVDCHIDQYEESPAQGWPRWMEDQIEWADYILVVCTQIYSKRFRGKERKGIGLGATWEGAILTQELYNLAATNNTIIPVVFSPEDVVNVPIILQGVTHYNISDEVQYTKLYRRITKQPSIIKPLLGKVRQLPPNSE